MNIPICESCKKGCTEYLPPPDSRTSSGLECFRLTCTINKQVVYYEIFHERTFTMLVAPEECPWILEHTVNE